MPITPNQVAQGVAKGGNALGLDKTNEGKSIVGAYLQKPRSPVIRLEGIVFTNYSSDLDVAQL